MIRWLIILLLIVGCDNNSTEPDSDRYYMSRYLIVSTEFNNLKPFGYTDSNGKMEFSDKKIFPTMYFPSVYETPMTMSPTMSENGDDPYSLYDYITGNFDIIVKDTTNNAEWIITDVSIIDGINKIDITSYGKQHITYSSGNFNLIFTDNNERSGLAIYLRYICDPEPPEFGNSFCGLFQNNTLNIQFIVPFTHKFSITISYLDGTIYDNWITNYSANYYSIPYEFNDDYIDAGFQFFRFIISEIDN